MKRYSSKTVVAGLVVLALIGLGTIAYAHARMGYGDNPRGYGGYSHYYRPGACAYGNPEANLTDSQREQLDAERKAYFSATAQGRRDLYAKRLELRAEIAKSEPDVKKATALQQEISELRGSLDQKRLQHIMAMRKIAPDAGREFYRGGWGRGSGHHMGYGPGMGSGRHRGYGPGMGYGPGYCR